MKKGYCSPMGRMRSKTSINLVSHVRKLGGKVGLVVVVALVIATLGFAVWEKNNVIGLIPRGVNDLVTTPTNASDTRVTVEDRELPLSSKDVRAEIAVKNQNKGRASGDALDDDDEPQTRKIIISDKEEGTEASELEDGNGESVEAGKYNEKPGQVDQNKRQPIGGEREGRGSGKDNLEMTPKVEEERGRKSQVDTNMDKESGGESKETNIKIINKEQDVSGLRRRMQKTAVEGEEAETLGGDLDKKSSEEVPERSGEADEETLGDNSDGRDSSLTASRDLSPTCDLYSGSWVRDESMPLYDGKQCSWLSPGWACQRSPRPFFDYEEWRWRPHRCDLPRFDRGDFLRRMRNKIFLIVGDSLGHQQFQSLLCLVTASKHYVSLQDVGYEFGFEKIPGSARYTGWAHRYVPLNVTIVFSWTPCLALVEPMDPSDPESEMAMHLDRPHKFLRDYIHRVHVVILNTGSHWNRGKVRANRWNFHLNGTSVHKTGRRFMVISKANRLVVDHVAQWVEDRISAMSNPPLVFLRTLSPRHFLGGDWNTGGRCDHVRELLTEDGMADRLQRDMVAETAMEGKVALKLLNITHLSQFRQEAHPSIWDYRNSKDIQDCLHWCLPGVPDVWNELVYAHIIMRDAGLVRRSLSR